jgi:hypothetical protein
MKNKTPQKSTGRKPGRPTRAEAARKAIAALAAAGIDPSSIDPRRILAEIAADASAPASARVMACRALLLTTAAPEEGADGALADKISMRAIEIMRRVN